METICDLQTHGLKFIQNDEFFPFGTDGVELANFVSGGKRDKAIDLGCGSGIIPVLVSGKKGISTDGIEIQTPLAELAKRNAELNALPVNIYNIRIQDVKKHFESGSYNIVTANPPYRKRGSGESSGSEAVRIVRHEIAVTLAEVLDAAAYLLSTGGKFYIVHIAERLDEVIIEANARRLTPKQLQILRPCDGKNPHIFLLKCVMDGKNGLDVLPERCVLGSTGQPYPD